PRHPRNSPLSINNPATASPSSAQRHWHREPRRPPACLFECPQPGTAWHHHSAPGVKAQAVTLSRGSELALLTAAHHDKVGAVVGLVPSPYVLVLGPLCELRSGHRAGGTNSGWSSRRSQVPSGC